jgi:hypothetical protein
MANEPTDRCADASPFAVTAGVPSSALIEKVLRALPEAPETLLGEETVERFCQRIRESARLLSEFPLTDNPIDRSESFRYLLLMLAYAVDAGLLNCDPLEPMFSQPYRLHLLDWGGASPDSVYRRTMVRDDRTYRVHGRLGNAKYLSMDLRQSKPACTITPDQLELDDEGGFEFFLGGPARERQWWPLQPGTNGLVVREFFDDWLSAQRSRLRIDCLDGEVAPRPEHQAGRVAAEFDVIGDWILEGAVRYWIEQSTPLAADHRNGFVPSLHRADTKLPVATFGWWDLQPDEALIVELDDPHAVFWALHLVTSLWHTLDYANRLTTFNCAQARPDPDGTYRFVVSARDPGVHNWLDTTGLQQGVIIVRFCQATTPVPPRARLVKAAEVAGSLARSPRSGPDERRTQIALRREGVAHLICD